MFREIGIVLVLLFFLITLPVMAQPYDVTHGGLIDSSGTGGTADCSPVSSATSGKFWGIDGANNCADWLTPAGSGDITAVGNCVTGPCAIETGTDIFPFIQEGTANGFETTFTVSDPTADNTINFPNAGGNVCLDTAAQTITNKTQDDVVSITSSDSDPADAGFIRMGNNVDICWEGNVSGTDYCIRYDASSNDFRIDADAYVEDDLYVVDRINAAQFDSLAVDPADTGIFRMGTGETVCWEASPTGVDECITHNGSDFILDDGITFNSGGITVFEDSWAVRSTYSNNTGFWYDNTADRTLNFDNNANRIFEVDNLGIRTVGSRDVTSGDDVIAADRVQGAYLQADTPQTSLPSCSTSDDQGEIHLIGFTNASQFPAMCVNNHGVYEWYPLGPGNLGFLWLVYDMGMNEASGGAGVTSDTNGSWVYASGSSPDDDHPGVITLNPVGVATEAAWWATSGDNNSTGTGLASGTTGVPDLKCEMKIQIDTATTDTLLTFGFTSDIDDPNDTHVAMYEFDTGDTNFQAITRDATGEAGQTETDTGVAPATATWYRALIVWNGTDFKFYLAAGDAAYTLEATHTTDIPDTDLLCGVYLQNLTTTRKAVDINYVRYSMVPLIR